MTEEKERYLRIISIVYYVIGILTGLMACFPLLHLGSGILLLLSSASAESEEAIPMMMGGSIFVIVSVIFIVLGVISAVVLIATGRFISLHRRYTFCVIGACIACLFPPFGMALGILTLVLLLSPEVKALFDRPEDAWTY